MDIPNVLIDQIRDGKTVLFLGSGASRDSLHPDHMKPPIVDDLSKIIADKFLSSKFYDRPLTQVSELAI